MSESIASAILSVLELFGAAVADGLSAFGGEGLSVFGGSDTNRDGGAGVDAGAGAGAVVTDGREKIQRERWTPLLCRLDRQIRFEVIGALEADTAAVKTPDVLVSWKDVLAPVGDAEHINSADVRELA